MDIKDKIVVVTGGSMGIGKGLCERFAAEGARRVIVADIEESKALEVASAIGGDAVRTDVSVESDIKQLVDQVTAKYGQIDLFCSNAGIMEPGGESASDEAWDRIWNINVLSDVFAARAVLPQMLERGSGYLLQTASAAGLLSQIGSAPYAVTKHAAVAFAEWLAITYGQRGIKVSCLCPQGVRTRMLLGDDGEHDSFLRAGSVSVEEVAQAVIDGLAAESFLILPHPEVLQYFQRKAADYDRWLRGMQRLLEKTEGGKHG